MKKTIGILILVSVFASMFYVTYSVSGLYVSLQTWGFAILFTAIIFVGVLLATDNE